MERDVVWVGQGWASSREEHGESLRGDTFPREIDRRPRGRDGGGSCRYKEEGEDAEASRGSESLTYTVG